MLLPQLTKKFNGSLSTATVLYAMSFYEADFTHSFFKKNYSDLQTNKAGIVNEYQDFGFLPEGTNTIYNVYDAGNMMWGAWMSMNGFSLETAKTGAHVNSILSKDGFDTDADQRAIEQGF